ncbi:MAG: pyridoxamine 5'-phosphate oxidase family protein [Clostridia bacterium]|nr:pyridoxamine 5'-phosphate oxidase family protein [Clostridia bacterium]
MSKIGDFLKETGTFFLATVDGEKPRIRPLGLFIEEGGRVIFGVGSFKNVYKQLCADPYVEIVACKGDGHWLRYSGRAVFETDPKYEEAALEAAPNLKNVYNESTGYHLMMFHLEDATAFDIPVMGKGESLL